MPDLFDNFFNKLNSRINGGKTTHHYGGATQVNTGSFYSYHSTASNNNYWLPKDKKDAATVPTLAGATESNPISFKERSSSITSVSSDMDDTPRSRFNSVSSQK